MTLSASSSKRLLTWWRYSGTYEKCSLGENYFKWNTTFGKTDPTHFSFGKNMPKWSQLCSEFEGSIHHLSLLHQPLSLCCIQAIGFLQKALLKWLLIDLHKEERSLTKATSQEKDPHFCRRLPSKTPLPASQRACWAGSWADFDLLLLHFAPARSAGESHRWFYSGPSHHWWCKTWTAPDPCPCGTKTGAEPRTQPPPVAKLADSSDGSPDWRQHRVL